MTTPYPVVGTRVSMNCTLQISWDQYRCQGTSDVAKTTSEDKTVKLHSEICIFRRLNGIQLDWEHPASKDRVYEFEKYEERHPDRSSELVFVTKKLVVEGVQIEDSGSYICKVAVY